MIQHILHLLALHPLASFFGACAVLVALVYGARTGMRARYDDLFDRTFRHALFIFTVVDGALAVILASSIRGIAPGRAVTIATIAFCLAFALFILAMCGGALLMRYRKEHPHP